VLDSLGVVGEGPGDAVLRDVLWFSVAEGGTFALQNAPDPVQFLDVTGLVCGRRFLP
jgi:hypothetical protein